MYKNVTKFNSNSEKGKDRNDWRPGLEEIINFIAMLTSGTWGDPRPHGDCHTAGRDFRL